MTDIYFLPRFVWNGVASFDLPLCGLSLAGRARRAYPEARLHFTEEIGKNGEELLGLSLKNLTDYPILCESLRKEILLKFLRNGVLIADMGSVYIEEDVTIGAGTHIGFGCYIERGCEIGEGCKIGPYAYLRKGSKVGHGCRVGDFTEMKNASLGDESKMAHLAYLGDADVGKRCNIGCGAVFVNYDGREKHRTRVADDCFIGSNVNLVAPVRAGAGSYVACGSTVTRDLPEDSFCIARSRETVKESRGREYYRPKKK
jgi:bifunctional UDP-N-acetylglucosamine pyrophosphorylase/glucosamine-1-phosphate N-acetyltransferase